MLTTMTRGRALWGAMGAALLLLVVSLSPLAAAAQRDPIRFTEDGFVYIDGRPRVVIGLYENPKDDAILKQVADSGFNLVRAGADKQALDRLQAHGLYAWIPLGGSLALKQGDEAARAALADTVKRFRDHPALLAWEGPDEALWMEWFASYQWLALEMPKVLSDLIAKAAATHGQDDVARWQRMAAQASDFLWRSMWKEAEQTLDTLWAELGADNPKPDLYVTRRIEEARRLGDELTRGWEEVWQLDKSHVMWTNHAPTNSIADMRHYNRGVNAAGCDIYPVLFTTGTPGSLVRDMDLTAVGSFTERNRAGAPGKACWMVLQGFGYHDINEPLFPGDPVHGRRPTYAETRFMAYDALLHGANAVLYWGTDYIEKDSQLWRDILSVAKELRGLEPAIVGVKPPFAPVVVAETNWAAFDGGDPKVMLRQAGDDWVLIAVNEAHVGVAFDVYGLPGELNGRTLYRLYSDEEHAVTGGGFHDGIKAQDVQVYATSRRFEGQ
jgi:hypothetical protein